MGNVLKYTGACIGAAAVAAAAVLGGPVFGVAAGATAIVCFAIKKILKPPTHKLHTRPSKFDKVSITQKTKSTGPAAKQREAPTSESIASSTSTQESMFPLPSTTAAATATVIAAAATTTTPTSSTKTKKKTKTNRKISSAKPALATESKANGKVDKANPAVSETAAVSETVFETTSVFAPTNATVAEINVVEDTVTISTAKAEAFTASAHSATDSEAKEPAMRVAVKSVMAVDESETASAAAISNLSITRDGKDSSSHLGRVMVVEDCNEPELCVVLDSSKFYNFGFVGMAKSGKSSLINAFLGFPAGQGPAKIDCIECTTTASEYTLPTLPHIKLWDLPGAGTRKVPVETYFKKFQLYGFDALIIVCGETISEGDLEISAWAAHHKIPCFYVRSKFDQTLRNVHEEHPTEDLQSIAKTGAERLRRNVVDEIRAFNEFPQRTAPQISVPEKVYIVQRNVITNIMANATAKSAVKAAVMGTVEAAVKGTAKAVEVVGKVFGISTASNSGKFNVETSKITSSANANQFSGVIMDEGSLITDLIVAATIARYQGPDYLDEVEKEFSIIQEELLAFPKSFADAGEEQDELRQTPGKEEEESNKPVADSEFFCPLDRNRTEPMVNPVTAADGVTYERANIAQWLRTSNQSPVDQEHTLEHKMVVPNKKLKAKIAQYKQDLDTWEKELAKRG